MRIRSLDLIAFGPFREKTLRFGNGGGVEVVFGPNEAGKSTTRRAILGLLFGIPHQSKDGHSVDEARVGATLELAAGKTLAVVRRKGKKNTLLTPRDEPIDEQVMAGIVGGMDAETFELTYGLDHIRLRQGGAALKLGNGEMGETLFSAATGLTGLHGVLVELRREAEELFVPHGTKRPLNEAQRAYTQAKKRVANLATAPDKWLEVEKQVEEARAKLQLFRFERSELAAERVAAQAMVTAMKALEAQRTHLAEIEPSLVETRAELEILVPSADVLSRSQTIAELQERLGSHRKAQLDRPRVVAELEAIEERALKTRRDAPSTDPPKHPPTGGTSRTLVEAHVRKLVLEGASLRERVKQIEAQALDAARSIQRAAQDLAAGHPNARSSEDLREAVELAQHEGNIDARLEAAREGARRARAAAEARLATLGTTYESLDELLALPVPSSEVVAMHARTFTSIAERRRDAAEHRRRLEEERADAERIVATLRAEGDVPTEDALTHTRTERDAQWEVLRAAKGAPKPRDAARFERSLRDADELADRLRREAARVTRKGEGEALVAVASRKLEIVDREEATIADEAMLEERAWTSLWESSRVAPRPPEEMAMWLNRHELACASATRALEAEMLVETLEAAVTAARDALAQALAREREVTNPSDTLARLAQTARRVLAARDEAVSARAVAESALQAAEQKRDHASRDRAAYDRDRIEWESLWAAVTQALDLRVSASAEEVQAAMDARKNLARIEEEAEKMRHRLVGIDRDASHFADAVRAVCDACALDLATRSPEEACAELARRVARATEQRARREMLEDQERRLEAQVGAVRAAVEHGVNAVGAVAAPPNVAELDARLADLDERIQQTSRLLGSLETGAQQFDQSPAIEQAAEAQRQLARVRDIAERYARARLGASAVARVLERYRRENQGPVLARASSLFAALTLGKYQGLEVGFDEADDPALVAVCDGHRLETHALSDGTLDQLYLALRVASLERLTTARGPLPLLLDDVLVHFDDHRAAAALAILSDLAKHTQVILFTHHARIVEIARRAISDRDGASAAGIHDLGAL